MIEALRRIVAIPSLFEAVTGAPFSQDSAANIGRALDLTTEQDSQEATIAAKLRAQIRANGFLERSMAPEKGMLQFYYKGL